MFRGVTHGGMFEHGVFLAGAIYLKGGLWVRASSLASDHRAVLFTRSWYQRCAQYFAS